MHVLPRRHRENMLTRQRKGLESNPGPLHCEADLLNDRLLCSPQLIITISNWIGDREFLYIHSYDKICFNCVCLWAFNYFQMLQKEHKSWELISFFICRTENTVIDSFHISRISVGLFMLANLSFCPLLQCPLAQEREGYYYTHNYFLYSSQRSKRIACWGLADNSLLRARPCFRL